MTYQDHVAYIIRRQREITELYERQMAELDSYSRRYTNQSIYATDTRTAATVREEPTNGPIKALPTWCESTR